MKKTIFALAACCLMFSCTKEEKQEGQLHIKDAIAAMFEGKTVRNSLGWEYRIATFERNPYFVQDTKLTPIPVLTKYLHMDIDSTYEIVEKK